MSTSPLGSSPANSGRLRSLTSHIPPGQFLRYILVGGWNTLFGYATFALFTMLLQRRFGQGYILASLLSSLLNITVSYLGYKWFVFKTRGNYLREWVRCLVIYSGGIILGLLLLPALVFIMHRTTKLTTSAPYLAGAIVTGITVIYSFFGHKSYSFRQS